jgi:hypothetical protein
MPEQPPYPEQPPLDQPLATMKDLAVWLHEYYTSLMAAGFTSIEALTYLALLSKPNREEK